MHRKIATSLAAQMTAAGIVPNNDELLSYAMSDSGTPILGERACSAHKHQGEWVVWDSYGAQGTQILWDGTRWQAGATV